MESLKYPRLPNSKDVQRDLKRFPSVGLGFEDFIHELFQNLSGWDSYLTPQSGDNGADVIAIAPKKDFAILIEAKNYAPYTNKIGSPIVRSAYGGISYYAHEVFLKNIPIKFAAIVASGHGQTAVIDDLYTAEGIEMARRSNIKLWTFDELQLIANAAVAGQHLLEPLGLNSPLISIKSEQKYSLSGKLAVGVFCASLIFTFGFWSFSQRSAVQPNYAANSNDYSQSSQTRPALPIEQHAQIATVSLEEVQNIANEIGQFLSSWNEIYKNSLVFNDANVLLPYVANDQKTALIDRFAYRIQLGCVLQIIEREPFIQGSVQVYSDVKAETYIQRNAQYVETCTGKSAKVVRDGQAVRVTFTFKKFDGIWRITDSVTSGGEI